MQRIYLRTPMPKNDFNNSALQLYWHHSLAWVFSCNFAAYFQNTFSQEHLWVAASWQIMWVQIFLIMSRIFVNLIENLMWNPKKKWSSVMIINIFWFSVIFWNPGLNILIFFYFLSFSGNPGLNIGFSSFTRNNYLKVILCLLVLYGNWNL